MILARQPTIAGAKHNRHASNQLLLLLADVVSNRVLDIHIYWRSISKVSDPALIRHQIMLAAVFFNHWLAHINIGEFQIVILMIWTIRCQQVVCFYHLLHIHVDEVIEGIDMLLHQTSEPEERWYQLPFVLDALKRLVDVLLIVHLFEDVATELSVGFVFHLSVLHFDSCLIVSQHDEKV